MNDPLDLLFCATTGDGTGWHAFDLLAPADMEATSSHRLTLWCPATSRKRFIRLASPSELRSDVAISAVPYVEAEDRRLHGPSSVVWCKTETGGAAKRLDEFRPRPTIVLQEGKTVRRVALWAIEKPLDPEDCQRVNRHLALKLGTKQLHGLPDFTYSPPGAILTEGRRRPVEVVCAGGSEESYRVGRVCRTLPRRAPDLDAWRKRQARPRLVVGAPQP